jgi:hypothetical protein
MVNPSKKRSFQGRERLHHPRHEIGGGDSPKSVRLRCRMGRSQRAIDSPGTNRPRLWPRCVGRAIGDSQTRHKFSVIVESVRNRAGCLTNLSLKFSVFARQDQSIMQFSRLFWRGLAATRMAGLSSVSEDAPSVRFRSFWRSFKLLPSADGRAIPARRVGGDRPLFARQRFCGRRDRRGRTSATSRLE